MSKSNRRWLLLLVIVTAGPAFHAIHPGTEKMLRSVVSPNLMVAATLMLSLEITLWTGGHSTNLFAAEASPTIRIEKGIRYLPEDRDELADLYRPANDEQRHPGVVIIHGGGWSGGKRDAARENNIGTTLAQHGYVCLSIDYLLAGNPQRSPAWPTNLQDCKTAVRWLRANSERLHLDADRIGAIGGSAGGHLAAMLAVTGPESGFDPAGPYPEHSCQIQCAVDLYGPTDLIRRGRSIAALGKNFDEAPELYRQFSVTTHLDPQDPPFLILHGTADKTVDLEQSQILADALAAQGIEHHLEVIEGAPHTFHLQPKQRDLRPLVLAFFDRHLKSKISILMIGDSTMASYNRPPADRPDLTGWGQVFGECFDPRLTIRNLALSGRSSKSYRAEGAWDRALSQPADYVFIQFGHNDQPGKGERSTDPDGDFRENLRAYIADAQAKGIRPILVTPVSRRIWVNGKLESSLEPYAAAVRAVGLETKTPVVDLSAVSRRHLEQLGDAATADYSPSPTDRSHFSGKGARAMSRLVAGELPRVVPALGRHVKKNTVDSQVSVRPEQP